MIPILAIAINMSVTTCGDTVMFKDGEYKKGQVVVQKVVTLPTSECWQFWPGDTTCKFVAIFGDDSAGTAVIVARSTKDNWFPMDRNGDKRITVTDLTLMIGKYMCAIFGRCN